MTLIPLICTATLFFIAFWSLFVLPRSDSDAAFAGWAALALWVAGFQMMLNGHPADGTLYLAMAAMLTWAWLYLRRGKRRRALRWLGYKAKAALARLAERARERSAPARKRLAWT